MSVSTVTCPCQQSHVRVNSHMSVSTVTCPCQQSQCSKMSIFCTHFHHKMCKVSIHIDQNMLILAIKLPGLPDTSNTGCKRHQDSAQPDRMTGDGHPDMMSDCPSGTRPHGLGCVKNSLVQSSLLCIPPCIPPCIEVTLVQC